MKNKKILYSISLLFIIIIIIHYFWSQKNGIKILPSETIANEQEKIITPQVPQPTPIEYFITKNYEIKPKDPKGNNKIVLLTIDDGPSHQSIQIINTLESHKIKAIFFINGINSKANAGIIEQEAKAGFSIGNHTWSHLNLKRSKDINLINKEIDNNTNLIKKLSSETPKFFRPPYGESNAYVRDLIKKDNMIFIDWSIAAKDWETTARKKDVFIKNVMNNIKPGSIILIHEHPWSLANLDGLITAIEQKGYTFADPKNIIE